MDGERVGRAPVHPKQPTALQHVYGIFGIQGEHPPIKKKKREKT